MTPAEPPTECAACKRAMQAVSFEGGWEISEPHSRDLHRQLAEKDARIRELQATVQSAIRIYRQVESERRPNGKGLSPFFFGQRLRRLIREWVELSEAALARSEGGNVTDPEACPFGCGLICDHLDSEKERLQSAEAKLGEARKWAFAYLNHIQQTESDRSLWAMEPTPKWGFILELAKAAEALWSGHDWESAEALLARDRKPAAPSAERGE